MTYFFLKNNIATFSEQKSIGFFRKNIYLEISKEKYSNCLLQ